MYMLILFNWKSIHTEGMLKKPNKINASKEDTFPDVIGLWLVLSTFESMSLSKKSLITHPIDLAKKAPRQNNHIVFISTEACDASKRADKVGHSSKRVPMGLSNLIR
tara:strand:+ start:382 stop:702 length:321 start_codon:yes stop_codon:yes gene_type:complete